MTKKAAHLTLCLQPPVKNALFVSRLLKTRALLNLPHIWTRRPNKAACGGLEGQNKHLATGVVNIPGRRVTALNDITKGSFLDMGVLVHTLD